MRDPIETKLDQLIAEVQRTAARLSAVEAVLRRLEVVVAAEGLLDSQEPLSDSRGTFLPSSGWIGASPP